MFLGLYQSMIKMELLTFGFLQRKSRQFLRLLLIPFTAKTQT